MCWLDNLGAWTSSFCIENGRKSCEAIILSTAAKQKNVNLQPDDLKGGKNPGSVICNKLGGTVMIATLANGSQMTFCKASDASLIDCNALADQFYSK